MDERVRLVNHHEVVKDNSKYVKGVSGEYVEIIQHLDKDKLAKQLKVCCSCVMC